MHKMQEKARARDFGKNEKESGNSKVIFSLFFMFLFGD